MFSAIVAIVTTVITLVATFVSTEGKQSASEDEQRTLKFLEYFDQRNKRDGVSVYLVALGLIVVVIMVLKFVSRKDEK